MSLTRPERCVFPALPHVVDSAGAMRVHGPPSVPLTWPERACSRPSFSFRDTRDENRCVFTALAQFRWHARERRRPRRSYRPCGAFDLSEPSTRTCTRTKTSTTMTTMRPWAHPKRRSIRRRLAFPGESILLLSPKGGMAGQRASRGVLYAANKGACESSGGWEY